LWPTHHAIRVLTGFALRMQVQHVVSDKACAAVLVLEEQATTIVIFRGTREPVDVLTDINFLAQPFTPLGWEAPATAANSSATVRDST
jgi:hypothetical protein